MRVRMSVHFARPLMRAAHSSRRRESDLSIRAPSHHRGVALRIAAYCAGALTLVLTPSFVSLRAQVPSTRSRLVDSVLGLPDLSTDRLWQILSARGLPLVEPVPGDDHRSLVTFLWRGDSLTHNVVVITPLTLIDLSGSVMERLARSNVWYRSILLPNDARFTYRFAPNDNLVPFAQDTNIFARFATMRRDPGNPKVFDNAPFGSMSILELPNAPSDELVYPGKNAARGVVTEHELVSAALGTKRKIWIYTPASYSPAVRGQYPLLIVMDGESYQTLVPTPTILDNLIARGAVPPLVAVFVDNPAESRERDLNCNARWDEFLAAELVPWVQARYRVARDSRHHVVAGSSLGGLAAACAALRNPRVFGQVIAQSGSFYRAPKGELPEWVARHLASTRRLPIRFALSIGRFETADIPSRDPSMLTASRHLRDVLLARGYDVTLRGAVKRTRTSCVASFTRLGAFARVWYQPLLGRSTRRTL
jgi:enterochelin esterase-like enzyme